ncbi:MAG: oligosaccharide flippase family protein [Verrucomicrobia bacterium]|nr:oligosaccharide flippase family protein [Verrucomicrobiota bacterium]
MRPFVPILLNQGATVILGLVYVKLVTHFVPVAVNGSYAVFLTLTQIGVMITHSGLSNHATRYWQREQSASGVYARFLGLESLSLLKYLIPILLVLALGLHWKDTGGGWLWAFPLLIVSNLALGLNQVATGSLNAERSFWKVLLLTFFGTAARTFLPVGMALLTTMSFGALATGFALHGAVILILLALLFGWVIRASPPTPRQAEQWSRELRVYGRPFVWLGIGAWFLLSADRWIVLSVFGEERAGLFATAAALGIILPSMVMAGMMQWVFPTIFQMSDHAKTLEDWKRIAKRCDGATVLFLALSVGGLVVLKLVSPFLVGWLIGERYIPAFAMLVPAGLAMVASQVNQFYYLLLQGQQNSAGMVRVMLIVSGIKTLGSIGTALISWSLFSDWLIASLFISGLLGRWLIRRMAFRDKV